MRAFGRSLLFTDPQVFVEACRLALHERVRLVAGYEPKYLLRRATASVIPAKIQRSPKVGASDLLYRLVEQEPRAYADLLHSNVLLRLGIDVPDDMVLPSPSDANLGVYWVNVTLLAVWLEEFQREFDERCQP